MKTKRNMNRITRKDVSLLLGMLLTALAVGAIWALGDNDESSREDPPAPVGPTESRDSGGAGQRTNLTLPVDASEQGDAGNLWKAFAEALQVERVRPEEDTRLRKRSVAKKAFYEMRGILEELSAQGLTGEALYEAAESRLRDADAEGALKMLDGYRRFEEDLANTDLDSMSPKERFQVLSRARREAFGEETAADLFFEKEAYEQYKLKEAAIAQQTDLTEAERRSAIVGSRNALQVELASRGSYVSFADERRDELDRSLRERYGDAAVEAMSDEERTAAVWDLYREQLPPEMLAKAEKVLAAQAMEHAAFEARRQETEAILNDEKLSFEQKQALLEQLSTGSDTGG